MTRRGRWTSLGEGGTAALGLPPRRAQALALQQGWRAVAGERLAESVRAEAVRGGVLELVTEGKAWRDAVLPALPALAARLATLHRHLGIRKVRLRLAGEPEAPAPLAVPAAEVPERPPSPRAREPRPTPPPGAFDAARLARLSRAYLARSEES